MTVDEAQEFVGETREAAVAKAAERFGVPPERLDVRELPGSFTVSGMAGRIVVLAAIREETAPLGVVGEFVSEVARRLAPRGQIKVEESQAGNSLTVRVKGDELARLADRSAGLGAALSHLAQRAAQTLLPEEPSTRVEIVGEGTGRGRSRPPRRREGRDGRGDDEGLERRARQAAEEVRESGEATVLGSMTSRERFVVHNAIRDIEGVTSESVGQGADKRVKIVPE